MFIHGYSYVIHDYFDNCCRIVLINPAAEPGELNKVWTVFWYCVRHSRMARIRLTNTASVSPVISQVSLAPANNNASCLPPRVRDGNQPFHETCFRILNIQCVYIHNAAMGPHIDRVEA